MFFREIDLVLERFFIVVRHPLIVGAPSQILHSSLLIVNLFEVEALDVRLNLGERKYTAFAGALPSHARC